MVLSENPTLYTYTITHDWGAAPNPYWGICSLALCKKKIRKNAKPGDWVVGFGSSVFPPKWMKTKIKRKNLSKEIIYAMKITSVITLKKYNEWCLGDIDDNYFLKYKVNLLMKIPNYYSFDYKNKMGDCIYFDFSDNFPNNFNAKCRIGIHNEVNLIDDLEGINVLLSDYYYYFGKNYVTLKDGLEGILPKRNHKSNYNTPFKYDFIEWFDSGEFDAFKNPKNPQPLLEQYKEFLPQRGLLTTKK